MGLGFSGDPSSRAVYCAGLRSLTCWFPGLNSAGGTDVNLLCLLQVGASATVRFLVQVCVCVCMCVRACVYH